MLQSYTTEHLINLQGIAIAKNNYDEADAIERELNKRAGY